MNQLCPWLVLWPAVTFLPPAATVTRGAEREDDAAFESHVFPAADGTALPYRLLVPGDGGDPSRKRPLLVFLHGRGERGTDNQAQLLHGKAFMLAAATQHGCFVLAPQCPADAIWPGHDWRKQKTLSPEPSAPMRRVVALIDWIEKHRPIDRDRVYVMGLSMGGFGTWDVVLRYPDRFAAAVPICGGGVPTLARRIVKLPLWVFHGAADPVVPVEHSREMVAALRAAGGQPRYTEYAGVGHDSWNRALAEPELLAWLLRQRRPPRESPPAERGVE